ncbi:MAG: chorismate mutase [Chitinivibrionales bacterium]|nr:chorismate mutase [Chitinivibrionales bacterium]
MIQLDLNAIAEHLESLEETIIFKLIDRAHWRANSVIYEKGRSGFAGNSDKSLFELRLLFQERMDAEFGRFCVPEERPFNKKLPTPGRKVSIDKTGLHTTDYNCINLTSDILTDYLALVPCICKAGDDGQYGSSVEHDVYAVQAIARRVHYGALYVAESKYRQMPEKLKPLIKAEDFNSLYTALTRKDVEEAIVARVREKVISVQSRIRTEIRHTITPETIVRFYHNCVIPKTKKGEVLYLLNRPPN